MTKKIIVGGKDDMLSGPVGEGHALGKPVLETERLILREFVAEDADALARVLSDPEAMRYYPTSFDRKAVEEWIARNQRRCVVDGHGL